MTLDEPTIFWFLDNPDVLVAFLKREAKIAKGIHGKRTPARRAWKHAKRCGAALASVVSEIEHLRDEAELCVDEGEDVVDTNVEVMQDLQSRWMILRVDAKDALLNALKVETDEMSQFSWLRRIMLSSAIKTRASGLMSAHSLTPWQRAREHARGILFE